MLGLSGRLFIHSWLLQRFTLVSRYSAAAVSCRCEILLENPHDHRRDPGRRGAYADSVRLRLCGRS